MPRNHYLVSKYPDAVQKENLRPSGFGFSELDTGARTEEDIHVWTYRDVVIKITQAGKRGRRSTLTISAEAIRLLYLEWYEKLPPTWEQQKSEEYDR